MRTRVQTGVANLRGPARIGAGLRRQLRAGLRDLFVLLRQFGSTLLHFDVLLLVGTVSILLFYDPSGTGQRIGFARAL